jgi:hypothetical protein
MATLPSRIAANALRRDSPLASTTARSSVRAAPAASVACLDRSEEANRSLRVYRFETKNQGATLSVALPARR